MSTAKRARKVDLSPVSPIKRARTVRSDTPCRATIVPDARQGGQRDLRDAGCTRAELLAELHDASAHLKAARQHLETLLCITAPPLDLTGAQDHIAAALDEVQSELAGFTPEVARG